MSSLSTASPSALSQRIYRRVSAPRGFVVLLSLTVAALWLLRRFLHDGPSNADVGEQLVFLGTWQIGYGHGANPPLFTWLANTVYLVIPDPRLAVEFVRFAMLWLCCVFLWRAVRAVTGEEDLGVIAGMAPFAVYLVGWESVFRHSNTMMLMMSIGLTFFALVRLDRRGESRDYLLFGIATAVGLLSKYNYAIFWVALVAAALTDPALRSRILHRRFLLSLVAALLLLLPVLWWLAGHVDGVMAHGRTRAYSAVDDSGWLIPRQALDRFAGASLGLLFPLAAIIALFAPKAWFAAPVASEPIRRYTRILTIHLVLLATLVLGSMAILSVTDFHQRYIYVGLLVVPWMILRLAGAAPAPQRRAQLITVLAAFMLIVVAGTALRYAAYPYYRAVFDHSFERTAAAAGPPVLAAAPPTGRSPGPGS